MVLGPPGGWACWCWRRAGSVLEGKAQVLVKSTSLGRPGSRPAGLAKLGSRRPLHRLSSDSVRCRLFCGDCCQDRDGRRDARRGHGQAQPGSPSSGASSRPGRLRSLPNHQPFLLPFWSTYSNFLLGIPPTPSAAHLILEGRPTLQLQVRSGKAG